MHANTEARTERWLPQPLGRGAGRFRGDGDSIDESPMAVADADTSVDEAPDQLADTSSTQPRRSQENTVMTKPSATAARNDAPAVPATTSPSTPSASDQGVVVEVGKKRRRSAVADAPAIGFDQMRSLR
jgi:hypothetical protein